VLFSTQPDKKDEHIVLFMWLIHRRHYSSTRSVEVVKEETDVSKLNLAMKEKGRK
jgi:hypothetical protein